MRINVGDDNGPALRRLYYGKESTMTKLSDFEPKVDNILTKLIASPYTAYILGACAIAGLVLGLIAYFK